MGSALDRRERSIRLSSESRGWRVGRKFRRTLVAVLRLRCPRVSRAMLCWQRAVALWAYYEYWYFLVCSLSAKGRKWTASSERWTSPKFACFSVRGRPWLFLPFPTVPAAGNSTPAGGGRLGILLLHIRTPTTLHLPSYVRSGAAGYAQGLTLFLHIRASVALSPLES